MKLIIPLCLVALLAPPAAAEPLDVLLVTADDLGLQLSCYGEKRIATPRLDAFAARGALFEVAWVTQASCSPSRSSMFTGLYPHSTGQYGLTNGGFSLHAPLRKATIPALLKKAGYRTGIIGKLHVAPEASFPFDFRAPVNTRKVRDVAREADSFLGEKSDAPFFLMVNYSDPHAFRDAEDRRKWYFPEQVDGLPVKPIKPSAETLFAFQGIDTPRQRLRTANYLNAVLRLDSGCGMLLDALEKRGLAESTLVIFCGDHGPPFARGKTTCYEAGLRVPFMVRWPGVSKAAVRSKAMVSTVDILPTILDAAGISSPAELHGRSLRPVVAGAEAPWREHLAGEFHFHGARPFYPRRAIRDGRYQLIHNLRAGKARPSTGIDGDPAYRVSRESRFDKTTVRRAFDTFANPPEFELYDLERDAAELENLADRADLEPVRARLQKALLEWRRETRDPCLDRTFLKRLAEHRAQPGRAN